MLWWLWLSEVRSRCSCTIYLASGNCRTSSIPSSPPSAVGCPVTHPTAPNTRLSVENTSEELLRDRSSYSLTGTASFTQPRRGQGLRTSALRRSQKFILPEGEEGSQSLEPMPPLYSSYHGLGCKKHARYVSHRVEGLGS